MANYAVGDIQGCYKEFVKEYVTQLERISKEKYVMNFFNEINKDLLVELKKINRYYPHVKINT